MDDALEAQLAALGGREFRFLRGRLLWSRILPDFFHLAPSDRVLTLGVGQGPEVLAYRNRSTVMVGVDRNEAALRKGRRAATLCGITNYLPVCADAQALPFRDSVFDKVLAVAIVMVVDDPSALCGEARRVLTPGGQMLMTFPGVQLRLRHGAAAAGRAARRVGAWLGLRSARMRGTLPRLARWREWLALLRRHGFVLARSEATSIIPPLHWLGLPRFWFRSDLIHSADRTLSRLPGFRALGQAVMAVFTRADADGPGGP